MKLNQLAAAAGFCAALAIGGTASASTMFLDFEGVAPSHPNSNDVYVANFYNGGTSTAGTSGTDFGIDFAKNARILCLNTDTEVCSNSSHGGLSGPASQFNGMFFDSGTSTTMNVAAGFDKGFWFYYTAINAPGFVSIFDGIGGTGNLLASLKLPTTPTGSCAGFNAEFCPFSGVGLAFNGVAKSVTLGGNPIQIVFDNMTFGSAVPQLAPSPVPLPATGWTLVAALAGFGALRRRKAKQAS